MTCAFKTELTCVILTEVGGNLSVNIGPTIEYAKKKDKKATIKAVKGGGVGDAVYKSHTITVGQGEAPNSVSNPMPPRKPKAKKAPRLPGGLRWTIGEPPSGSPAPRCYQAIGSRRYPCCCSCSWLPVSTGRAAPPANLVAALGGGRAVPPAAGAARAAPSRFWRTRCPPSSSSSPTSRCAGCSTKGAVQALYAFQGQDGEMSLVKGDEVEVKEKDDNGWWMVVKNGQEGWAPSNYLKLIEQPAAPPPPPPVAKRSIPRRLLRQSHPQRPGGIAGLAAALNGRTNGSGASTPGSSPGGSRPTSAIGGRGAPPALKAKPVIPPKPERSRRWRQAARPRRQPGTSGGGIWRPWAG
jgi:myosin-1